jgi:HAD superfamily hydrolase (TIGR01484 family)
MKVLSLGYQIKLKEKYTMKIQTIRDTKINYNKKIYYDENEKSWIITNQDGVKEISKSDDFSSNRLAIKFRNSNLPEKLDKKLRAFYDSWIMYQDGETHEIYRKLTQDLLTRMLRQLNKNNIVDTFQKFFSDAISENKDLAIITERLCKVIMANLFGISEKDYLKLLRLSKPITRIMYSNTLKEEDAQTALQAISDVELFLNKILENLSDTSILKEAIISKEIPTGLIINLLIDGEDPLESVMKSIAFQWASQGLTEYNKDMGEILKKWTPFTSISRVCTKEVKILGVTIQPGERVLGILSMADHPCEQTSKPIAFGSGSHRCLGEELAMRLSKMFYSHLEGLEPVYLDGYQINDSFGYFTFTEIIVMHSVFVFDLDGTLVHNGLEISPLITQELLKLQQKAKIIFASARPIRDMMPLLEKFPVNDLIGGNGSIVRYNQEISLVKTISPDLVKKFNTFIKANSLEYIIDYDWNYSAEVSPSNPIMNKLDTEKKAKNIPINCEGVIKIIVFNVSTSQYEQLGTEDKCEILYHEDSQELVVTAKGIDKYQTLLEFIGHKKYMAFGNDKNDVELLRNAEWSVAVGENKEVCTIAKKELSTNNDEIAKFISLL